MDKDTARNELADILERKMLQDPGFKETTDGDKGFVESNLDDIVALGNGSWNDELARRHVMEMRTTLLDDASS